MSDRVDVSHYFDIKEASPSLKQIIPRRKRPVRPIYGLTAPDADTMMAAAFEKWGYTELTECWTYEMRSRTVPFVSTDERPKRVLEVFDKYIDAILSYFIPNMAPHYQTINKVARLGWPINRNPVNDDGTRIKMDVFLPLAEQALAGDWQHYRDAFYTINLRMQNEPPSKIREGQFIDDDGRVTTRQIDRRQEAEYLDILGRRAIPPRGRGVYCPPVLNLIMQTWDTMLHRAIMKRPLCYANIYQHLKVAEPQDYTTFDCKHYERDLGMLVSRYSAAIGGLYQQWMDLMLNLPHLVPSDSWKKVFLIRPKFGDGVYPQFSSGLCNVSTLGKLANIAVQTHYFVTNYNMTIPMAIHHVTEGEYLGTRRWMYGDDNRVHGKQDAVKPFIDHMGYYFHIELDDSPKYLGSMLDPDTQEFLLPARTYQTKLYLPERDISTKDYPALGYKLRRETFSQFGQPIIGQQMIPFEDELLRERNLPWEDVMAAAYIEERNARSTGLSINPLELIDKEYLMTEEEKVTSGASWGFKPERTRAIVLQIVGDTIRKQLTFH